MKITHNNTEFELKEQNTLSAKQAAIPIFAKYRLLTAEYLSDFDEAYIEQYTKKIAKYEMAISQIEHDEAQADYKNELESKLAGVRAEFENDKKAKVLIEAKNEIEALIFVEIAYDIDLMKKLFSKMLIGDLSRIKYEGAEYEKLAMEVLAHFFSQMLMSKKE